MSKWVHGLWVLAVIGLIIVQADAQVFHSGSSGGSGSITVKESDDDPTVTSVTSITVPAGLLTDNGSGSVSLASPSVTLDQAFDNGKTIDGANSLANAVRIGDGVTPICLYTDASLGPQIRPCTDANTRTLIATNFTWSLYDEEGGLAMETVNPDAASTLLIWDYPNAAYRPKKSVWFGAGSLSTDGTQCGAPTERQPVASQPKVWTIICTDNAGSTIWGYTKMPANWDAGTVTFTHVYQQTAADTGVLNGDIAAQCRGNGEAPSSTYGDEVAIDDAAVVGSGANDMTTSAAVTPVGTCAAGDMLYWQYQLDTATDTAVSTLHHLGFHMTYSETSRSQ